MDATCWPHLTDELTGWSFTFVCVQVDVRSAVGWEAIAFNGLLRHGIIKIIIIIIIIIINKN